MGKRVPVSDSVEVREDLSNLARVLRDAKRAIAKNEYILLGHLSNETIHSATINQDSVNIVVAVLVYVFHKIFQRKRYQEMDGWGEFINSVNVNLDLMIRDAENDDAKSLLLHAGEIRQKLNEIEGDLGSYVKDVFRKAEINKAFKIYEHGISSAKTAELLGVSLWDLASYIGQSTIHEAKVSVTIPEQERIKMVEDFFS